MTQTWRAFGAGGIVPPRHATLAHVVRMSKRAGHEFLADRGKETYGEGKCDCGACDRRRRRASVGVAIQGAQTS